MATFDPPFDDITIGADTWTNADWEANPTGTFSEVVNAFVGLGSIIALGARGTRVVTASGDITVDTTDGIVVIRQTAAEDVAVLLPDDADAGFMVGICDGAGVAGTVHFTITAQSGQTINGATTFLFNTPYVSNLFLWDGTGWTIWG